MHACRSTLEDPTQLIVPQGTYTDLSGGITHTCAIRDDGTVACWGQINTAPPGVFTRLDSGSGTCGQRADGTVECWGGYENTPSGPFADFSVGTNHACGVRADGSGECWGVELDTELQIPAGESWVQLSAGGVFTCGLTAAGKVLCWGRNDFHQTEPPASF